jgi:tetratricopeptide (TPR) repeat protein
MTELRSGLEAAATGHGGLFLISGAPGVGKTRLCLELVKLMNDLSMAALIGHCSDQDEGLPYLPFVEILESALDRASGPDRLRAMLEDQGPELSRILPKLRRLMPELAPLDLPPEQARRHLFNSISDFIGRLAREKPLLLIIEDLHWADAASLSLLVHLSKRLPDLPMTLVATHRDAEADIGPALAKTLENLIRGGNATRLSLKGLALEQVSQMLKGLSHREPPLAVVKEIYAESRGNPFFVEELMRHLDEENRLYDDAGEFRSVLNIGEYEVPQSVRLVVGRRLARVGEPAQKMLATAAVIGRSFRFEILKDSTPSETLLESIEEAQKAGLIFSDAASSEARFEFSHELIRQTVLNGLPAPRRQMLHLVIAEAVERIYSEVLEDHYAELGYHYSWGANLPKAVKYLGRAGVNAARQSAHSEAVAFASTALEKLRQMPEDEERDRREMRMQHLLVSSLMQAKGYGAAEIEAPVLRMRELAAKFGSDIELLIATGVARAFYATRRELSRSRILAIENAAISERVGLPKARAGGAWNLGEEAAIAGEWPVARMHFERVLELFGASPQGDPFASQNYWYTGFGLCRALFILGYPEQAQRKASAMFAEAEVQGDPQWIAVAALTLGLIDSRCGDARHALEFIDLSLSLAAKHGTSFLARLASTSRAHALLDCGRTREGGDEMRHFSSQIDERNEPALQVHRWQGLARVCAAEGHPAEALEHLEHALRVIESNGESAEEAALHSSAGAALMTLGVERFAEAERHFKTAIEIARHQSARLYELRATMGLTRLLSQQHRHAEARAMLVDIFGWFTEGFDTPDLKDAKALLDDLTPTV